MRTVGTQLHWAQHIVLDKIGGRSIYGAGDIEAHRGIDGRYYLLDLARAMPPEAPQATPHLQPYRQSIFFRMLRPELLQILKNIGFAPLSCDAFSSWGIGDPHSHQLNRDVLLATRFLIQHLVPAFASKLCTHWDDIGPDNLVTEAHLRGINVRHLGYVR